MRPGPRLSARRPLPWRWWLPVSALGFVCGQSVGLSAGATGLLLVLASATAAPSTVFLHRAAGTAAVLGSSAAALGAAQIWEQERARVERFARVPHGASEVRARVVAVRPHRSRGDAQGVSLDVLVTEESENFAPGERIRLAVWRTEHPWHLGDRVAVRIAARAPRGFCNRGADGYAGAAWRQGVVAVAAVASDLAIDVAHQNASCIYPRALLGAAREAIAAALARAVAGEAERAVLTALLYGDQSAIPADLRRAYARTGTAHVLSVSGLHIAVVAMTAFLVVQWLLVRWRWLAVRCLVVRVAAVVALGPAAFYALLSGGAVATLRSLVMGMLALGAVALLRRADVWPALAAAALVLCASDPGVGHDPSFQLSFAAVAALVLAGGRFEAWRATHAGTWHDPSRLSGRILSGVAGAIVVAVAAGIATGPITSYHFGSVALLGVLANLAVVPLVGWLALLLGLSGAALLPLSSLLSDALLSGAGWTIRPANAVVVALSAWRWSAVDVALASPTQVAAALTVAMLALLPRGRARRAVVVVALLLVGLCVAQGVLAKLDPRVMVRFLDVGQGDAAVVARPAGAGALVVDGGGLGGAFDPGERVVVPALWRAGFADVASMALSHADYDHYGGLSAIVRALPVRTFWSSGRESSLRGFRALSLLLAERAVARRTATRGTAIAPDGNGSVRVLHPPAALGASSENDASLVLAVRYGATRILLTGDIEAAAEGSLLRGGDDLAATIVKVAHHGSRTSSTRGFVAAVRPALAVASLGERNRFGFPAPEVRARYQGFGAAWRQTDRDGEVVVTSDGQLELVETCR